MKNIIKYILILLICLISVGCGQDTPDPVAYKNPLSKIVDERNTDIMSYIGGIKRLLKVHTDHECIKQNMEKLQKLEKALEKVYIPETSRRRYKA